MSSALGRTGLDTEDVVLAAGGDDAEADEGEGLMVACKGDTASGVVALGGSGPPTGPVEAVEAEAPSEAAAAARAMGGGVERGRAGGGSKNAGEEWVGPKGACTWGGVGRSLPAGIRIRKDAASAVVRLENRSLRIQRQTQHIQPPV